MADQETTNQSLGELVQQLSNQTSSLIRQEMRLAQAELQEKGKRAGMGAGLFGAGGLFAAYALGALIAGAILLLAEELDAWLAAFIVAAALALIAAVLSLVGKKQVDQAIPPKPELAIETVSEDVQEVKERARR